MILLLVRGDLAIFQKIQGIEMELLTPESRQQSWSTPLNGIPTVPCSLGIKPRLTFLPSQRRCQPSDEQFYIHFLTHWQFFLGMGSGFI
jgi:hypothetical protein